MLDRLTPRLERSVSDLAAKTAARVGRTRHDRSDGLPPGPGAPGPLQLFSFLYQPVAFLRASRATHGEVMTIRLPGLQPIVQISKPEHVEELFKGPARQLHAGEANSVLEPFLGSHSVLVIDDDAHLEQRRLLLPPFRGERMKAYGDTMRDATVEVLGSLAADRVVVTQELTQRITLEVILRTVFGLERRGKDDELVELLVATLRSLDDPKLLMTAFQHDLGPLSPWGRFLGRRARVRELLEQVIRQRRAQGGEGREDVLSLLVGATHADGEPMTRVAGSSGLSTVVVPITIAAPILTAYVAATVTTPGDDGTTSAFSTCVRIADEESVAEAVVADGETGEVLDEVDVQVTITDNPSLARRLGLPNPTAWMDIMNGALACRLLSWQL